MQINQVLAEKWAPLLDHERMPAIKDNWRRNVTAVLLENQEKYAREEGGAQFLAEDAPTNRSGLNGFDPILIALVRRAMPNLVAYDICGVQPMSGPTGLIFSMRSKYSTQGGAEALFGEANTAFSAAGLGSVAAQNGTGVTASMNATNFTAATAMATLAGEGLGSAGNVAFPEMAFSIDKVTATAKTRALKAEYSHELAQDLKAVHNLDAETELANILSAEILAEINREIIRTIYSVAATGAAQTAVPGTFDLDVDSQGRWSVEKFKGLVFQIDREANAIAKATRRGRGNIIITSSDVASALVAAGVLDYTPAYKETLTVDDTGNTFAGTLMGRYKVYIDPYAPSGASSEYFVVGYKGASAYDAGLFYCPYVPLQMYRAVDPGTMAPKIGFKTRYATVANPFATSGFDGALTFNTNVYYRRVAVANLF